MILGMPRGKKWIGGMVLSGCTLKNNHFKIPGAIGGSRMYININKTCLHYLNSITGSGSSNRTGVG